MREEGPREYDIAALSVFDELEDWVYVRDLNPTTMQNYWGNRAIRQTFNNLTLEQYLAQDLKNITSPAMREWSREMYGLVQVQGKRLTKRRTIYPTGKPPHVMDLVYAPLHFRVTGENGESEVRVLALVHGKRVQLGDPEKEANRAAVLMNFSRDAIFLVGPSTDSDADAATSGPRPEPAHRPAAFSNLRARLSYGCSPHADGEQAGAGHSHITLARVLDTCSSVNGEERQALQDKILNLQLQDSPIVLEEETPPHLRAGGSSSEANLPLHRTLTFSPVTDPVSGVMSVMCTEHDISDLKSALADLRLTRAQSSRLLYAMLPEDVADTLCAGRRVPARFHDMVSVFFADIVGFTTICSQSSPVQICDMLDELYTGMLVLFVAGAQALVFRACARGPGFSVIGVCAGVSRWVGAAFVSQEYVCLCMCAYV